jgi:glycosyltransferase involved in cell wall biosynthesis
MIGDLPDVTVIIATRDRPELLRRALDAIIGSEYEGDVSCLVVFDQCDPDRSIEMSEPGRAVRVTSNTRTPGLAGARNTGLLLAETALVAFCDDDDEWLPGKLSKQVTALRAHPTARFAATGIVVRYKDHDTERIPEPSRITHDGFLADRMTEVHPSSFLADRRWLLDEVGLVDECLPGSYAEDYDLLLRVSAAGPIAVATEPLVRIWWHGSSFFFERWRMIDDALGHLLAKHPDFARSRTGKARIVGQQAFARAAMGARWAAVRTALSTLRLAPTEKRAYLAMIVATGAISAERALAFAHRFGKGI